MRLLPAAAAELSSWEDGLWFEEPGYPPIDGSWVHPPPEGHVLPEFEFEEGSEKNKNGPMPVFEIGTGNDCHVRLEGDSLPQRACCLRKEGKSWFLEALQQDGAVHHGSRAMAVAERVQLRDGDTFSLRRPPTPFTYRVLIREEDNQYLDHPTTKDFPNRYPGRFPCRSSLFDAPPAPVALWRLAWQTDRMRRRSEEEQVRPSDWAAFSQHVKKHYLEHGIFCTSWSETGRDSPVDAKPPSLPARPYPQWIRQLLLSERPLPGLDHLHQQLAFTSCLNAPSSQETPASGVAQGEPKGVESHYGKPLVQESHYTQWSFAGLLQYEPLPGPPPAVQAMVHPVVTADETASRADPRQHLRMSLREWLESMDDSKYLLQYHDKVAANYDSLEQICAIYFHDGTLDSTFFDDVGMKKLGHRRIVEKWFYDHCR